VNTKSIIAAAITEIRGNMSDKEFSDALSAFTNGEYHPASNTIQKYRTGQREPSYSDLQRILEYGKAVDHISPATSARLANFFSIPQLARQNEEIALSTEAIQVERAHLLCQAEKGDELAQSRLCELNQQLQNKMQQRKANEHNLHSVRNEFEKFIEIPILTQIPISEQVESEDSLEGYMTMPRSMLIGNDYFYLKVSDEAFKDVNIHKGDLVLVRKSTIAKNDQTVMARLSNKEVICKKLFTTEDGRIILLPASADFQPINPSEVEFIGIVEKVMRNY